MSQKRTHFHREWHGGILTSEPRYDPPVHRRKTYVLEFQLKSLAFALSATLVAAIGQQAQAQNDPSGKWVLSPQTGSSGRRAVAANAQPQIIVVPGQPQFSPVFPRQPIVFTYIPAILMSDGTVLANFGFGYEPVTRACGGGVVINSTPMVIAGNGRVIRGGTQPAPNQATESARNLPSNQVRYPILTSASQMSCYTRDSSGRWFAVR